MCTLLVDYNAIDQSKILYIYKYLLIENNMWNVWVF